MERTILVPLDGSPFGEQMLPLACSIARRAGATLLLAHVHELGQSPCVEGRALPGDAGDLQARAAERAYLEQLAQCVAAAARSTTMQSKNTIHKQGHHYRAEQAIRYWMRAPVITVTSEAPLSEALALMREHDVRRLPVVGESGELQGMITQGDIRGADVLHFAGMDLLAIADALRRVKVQEVMAERPLNLRPETSLHEAALLMIENKIGGLPVVGAAGNVVGIITESDLFEVLVQLLDRSDALFAESPAK